MTHTADTNDQANLINLIRNYTIGEAKADGYTLGAPATIGDTAIVYAMGQMRRGTVVKIGRKNIHVAYTTRNAVVEAERYSTDVRTYVKAAPMAEVWILSAPTATDTATDTDATTLSDPAMIELIELAKNHSVHQAMVEGYVLGAPARTGDIALIHATVNGLDQLRRGKVISVSGDNVRVAYTTRTLVESPIGCVPEIGVHITSGPAELVWIKPGPNTSPQVADSIIASFAQVKARRLDAEGDAEWSDADSHRQYIEILGTARCWKLNNRAVCASVVMPYIPGWGHAVAEMLDQACDAADVAQVTHATGLITELAPNLYRLTW